MRKNSAEFLTVNGLDTSKMDTMGFSEGDLLLQVTDCILALGLNFDYLMTYNLFM